MQKRQEKKLDKKELWSYNTTVAMKGLGVMVTRGSPKPLLRVRILQPLRKPAFFRFTPIGCGFLHDQKESMCTNSQSFRLNG